LEDVGERGQHDILSGNPDEYSDRHWFAMTRSADDTRSPPPIAHFCSKRLNADPCLRSNGRVVGEATGDGRAREF
jgi:hypothetical protein